MRKKIIEARKKAKLTQVELAERIGLGPTSISDFENKDDPIKLEHLIKICQVCGVDANWFFLNSGNVEAEQDILKIRDPDCIYIPYIVKDEKSGTWGSYIRPHYLGDFPIDVDEKILDLAYFKIDIDIYEPYASEGDVVTISRSDNKPVNGNTYVFKDTTMNNNYFLGLFQTLSKNAFAIIFPYNDQYNKVFNPKYHVVEGMVIAKLLKDHSALHEASKF